ncbi:hypothetical protein G6F57_008571 [Rhizopus arrhizus]|jgi:hypothetical protein|uniref:Uncharacterized protein n=1 Tax=Rhizopus oryzae TaxID=64495 RepID=A0A9P6X5Z0_RHIOR|nr:hypothetical protein G6F23_003482 [Rhizopus arrhizus]KAG1418703.1 hypothetical protein G6F58_004946 [Rhizopus delemar]KAG0768074.1 hypothetical protein G6F24_002255 [Rhizopus arrhizus]KAG0778614.1 hypothetical protein G6F22_011132 [Rhizopus arrhizus]KAG0786635.1 hypothetical protein G6F21_008459 [Rhizopus arrhizus]
MNYANVAAVAISAAATSKTTKYPIDRTTGAKATNIVTKSSFLNTTANVTVNATANASSIIWKTAKLSAQTRPMSSNLMAADNLANNDVSNSYYSFCPKCGVDILIFSHESYCPLAK